MERSIEINDVLMKDLYEKKEGVFYELYRFEADEIRTADVVEFCGQKRR